MMQQSPCSRDVGAVSVKGTLMVSVHIHGHDAQSAPFYKITMRRLSYQAVDSAP